MEFEKPLIAGTILKRYKRFLCDIEVDGNILTAHCPNSGSMKGIPLNDAPAMISPADNPARKLKYTLEMIHNGSVWVGTNTMRTNLIAHEGMQTGAIRELASFDTIKREVKISAKSRIDFVGYTADEPCYIEVKNVSLVEGQTALFPDAVTTRGQRHLDELIELRNNGWRAAMLYIIQRTDCTYFAPAQEIDPIYAKKLTEAAQAGVEIIAYQAEVSPQQIQILKPITVNLP